MQDMLTLMRSPMDTKDPSARDVISALGDCVANHERGRLLEIPNINLEVLQRPVSGNRDYMHELESLHKAIILYSWLSFRFGGMFTDRTLAAHVKELVEERLMRALTEFSSNKKLRKDASLKRQIALQKQLLEQGHASAEETPEPAKTDGLESPVDLSEGSPESSFEKEDPSEEASSTDATRDWSEGYAETHLPEADSPDVK
ncbi:P-loop containing nucleoside triphosphate hydrolase protein [Penicillium capsulatum]|uniref:P-loop containing nucleoside triphosphate hydrolase protein n=1 Tax=Penicillium capsulatum TaxID=69766 RepID=A0A9W9LF92_9EURO|nr:P-loop containing nucleoside triphosphate hydrolase protein [Penicillium capsulatum]KAJ6112965.1 P-loop containing nucleoside triphosphate hydrolase protein [Penicillium capsulatum]